MVDFGKIAEDVDEAIKIVETGNIPKCLKRRERIVAEIRRSRVFGTALAELVEPFIIHADEYELDRKAFAEELREYFGLLKIALMELAGEEP